MPQKLQETALCQLPLAGRRPLVPANGGTRVCAGRSKKVHSIVIGALDTGSALCCSVRQRWLEIQATARAPAASLKVFRELLPFFSDAGM